MAEEDEQAEGGGEEGDAEQAGQVAPVGGGGGVAPVAAQAPAAGGMGLAQLAPMLTPILAKFGIAQPVIAQILQAIIGAPAPAMAAAPVMPANFNQPPAGQAFAQAMPPAAAAIAPPAPTPAKAKEAGGGA